MPEIKNTFTQGKMNKDLDERIVPNGQYRNAMNIQVSTSEGADVGTVQNILGNTVIPLTLTDNGGSWECVGSIADEKNDVLYSFITDDTDSAIIEYAKDETVTPVLVDIGNGVLQFSTGDIITGINVIDEFLLWTDGVSEPKKINIQRCINGSSDLSTHTKLYLGSTNDGAIVVDANGVQVDITEEHITVIKKKPLRPLTVKINPANPSDKKPLFEKIFPRFSYRYRYEDGEYSAFAPFTDVVFNSEYPKDESGYYYDENTAYDTKEPYNAGMRNMIDSIELYDFVSSDMPEDVVQIDILYKQENSTTVHVVEIIKSTDAEWGLPGFNANSSYDGKFEVKSENIYAATPENQLLRPWDNVPKTALAQEVTGNRVVYGNYTQSYDLGVSPKVSSDYKLRYDGYKQDYAPFYESNLLNNSSFDTTPSSYTDWDLGTGITYSGVYENVEWSSVGQFEKVKQDFTSAVGETYKISFTVSELSNVIEGDLNIQIIDSTGNYIEIDEVGISAKTYEYIETMSTATTLATTDLGKFFIQNKNASPTVTCVIDDITIQKQVLNPTLKTFANGGFPSVKSQRNYQLGIVYGDKYGRETPVFTSSESSVVIPWEDDPMQSITPISSVDLPLASFSLQLKASLDSVHPTNADGTNTFDYYKFFVKETSGEYYNLVMDALWNPTKADLQKEEHVWLSFASSERNKISKDDYIILKKKFSSDPSERKQVSKENKYRVLDVQNEAPDAIKYKYIKYGEILNDQTQYFAATTGVIDAYGYLNANIFPYPNNRPIIVTTTNDQPIELHINRNNWLASEGLPLTSPVKANDGGSAEENLFFSFTKVATNNNEHSKKYKIASVRSTGITSTDKYIIRLAEKITNGDSATAENDVPGEPTGFIAGDLDHNLQIRIEKKLIKDPESFSGRFFVKIAVDSLIQTQLEDIDELEIDYNYHIESSANTFWHADTITPSAYNITEGLINNDGLGAVPSSNNVTSLTGLFTGPSGVAGVTNTEAAWQKLLTEMSVDNTDKGQWFIDRMHMVASQTGDDAADNPGNYAKFVTQGWYGGNFNTPGTVQVGSWGGVPAGFIQAYSGSYYADYVEFPAAYIKPQTPGANGANLINGLEGIVQSGSNHVDTDGLRRWETINWTEGSNSATVRTQDDTYEMSGEPVGTIGGHFLHLSFLAPGSDLHDGSFKCGASSSGLSFGMSLGAGNIMNQLQGIHGGGVFTWDSTSGDHIQTYPIDYLLMELGPGFSASSTQAPNCYNSSPPGYNPGNSGEWQPLHNNQWTLPAADQLFEDELYVGAKFRFSGDTNDPKIVYTIMGLKVKKVYNHTPWRTSWKDDGGTLVGMGNSVEEAAIAWAKSCTNITSPSGTGATLSGSDGTTATENALMLKLKEFCKANNRRKVYILELDKDPTDAGVSPGYNPVGGTAIDSTNPTGIQMVTEDFELMSGEVSQNPAIWETEPKDNVDLDIYYEAGQAIPINLTMENIELFAPIGCRVEFIGQNPNYGFTNGHEMGLVTEPLILTEWYNDASQYGNLGVNNFQEGDMRFTISTQVSYTIDGTNLIENYGIVRFIREDGSYTESMLVQDSAYGDFPPGVESFSIRPTLPLNVETGLSWYNCFSFGSGIESDRIRDDFNGMTITNGVRANSTLDRPYEEEHRKSGLIYSGIYNSTSGTNNLNQFITAEKITKDLNPTYGSIQKLYSRVIRQSSSLVAFCEDRVVSIISNKDALYNADGNPQIVASNAVLGDANAFVGDYGISKNPESFAKQSYRAYFTDKQRGAVLRLSMD